MFSGPIPALGPRFRSSTRLRMPEEDPAGKRGGLTRPRLELEPQQGVLTPQLASGFFNQNPLLRRLPVVLKTATIGI